MFANTNTDKQVLKKWIDVFIPQLRIGTDMDKSTHAKSFKEALKKGIPIEIRGDAWMYLVGNDQRIGKGLYDFLLNRVRLAD